ncbi:MAG: DNA-processing protein DprA [Candidatus Sericytochromatia bacterium]
MTLSPAERAYRIALSHLPEIGAVRMGRLLSQLGSAEAIWRASRQELLSTPRLSETQADKLQSFCQRNDPAQLQQQLQDKHIQTLVWEDADYPSWLASIYDPPQVIFYRGETRHWQSLTQTIAVVGTRNATPYGLETAQTLSRYLGSRGVAVVSGLAYGIDAAAHKGALAVAGLTVAVLGAGVDRPSPAGNRPLARQIVEKGLLISEFPPGMNAQPWTFRVRNRLISGLSQAVVVVEAGLKSGTLITVDCANEQGRDVFAVPGPLGSSQSTGTHALIQQGAHLLADPDEIWRELNWPEIPAVLPPVSPHIDLTKEEAQVYEVLSELAQPVDALVSHLGILPSVLLSLLTLLELKGLAEQLPGKLYKRKS